MQEREHLSQRTAQCVPCNSLAMRSKQQNPPLESEGFSVCRRRDLNPHALAGTGSLSQRVCQFRHSDVTFRFAPVRATIVAVSAGTSTLRQAEIERLFDPHKSIEIERTIELEANLSQRLRQHDMRM